MRTATMLTAPAGRAAIPHVALMTAAGRHREISTSRPHCLAANKSNAETTRPAPGQVRRRQGVELTSVVAGQPKNQHASRTVNTGQVGVGSPSLSSGYDRDAVVHVLSRHAASSRSCQVAANKKSLNVAEPDHIDAASPPTGGNQMHQRQVAH